MHYRGLILSATLAISLNLACGEIPSEADRLAQSNNTFALALYQKLGVKDGNLFFSPYSIQAALAMTYTGARGETEKQMAAALSFSNPGEVAQDFAQWNARLKDIQKFGNVQIAVANSLWPSDRFSLDSNYLFLTKKYYGVSITPVDYTKTESARQQINRWVEAQTSDKIKELIRPRDLGRDTLLTLVNAIYFKGNWQHPFQALSTQEGDFRAGGANMVKVPLMHQKDTFRYMEDDTVQILELPYKDRNLSMVIVLPRKSLTDFNLPAALAKWNASTAEAEVQVYFPKFKMTWGTFQLNDTLQSLGMQDAFTSNADFSGIGGKPHELIIGAVLHKAFIDVNEEGTEAAAATAVKAVYAALPKPTPVFRADHPFVFFITENKTRAILFMGRVVNPLLTEN